jgi:hypothetical protein
MRRLMAFGLLLLASTSAVGADRPIPQDSERMAMRSRERLAWNRRTVGEAYERVGKKDPQWDELARKALELAAKMFALQGDPPIALADVQVPAKKAVEAGCDDPMILYLYARSSTDVNQEEYHKRIRRAADALATSGYPPIRRAAALLLATDEKATKKDPTPADREEVGRAVMDILELLRKSVDEDPRGFDWEDGWDRLLKTARAKAGWAEGDVKAGFDRVDARLANIRGVDALRLSTKGEFYTDWGWDARSTSFAFAVGEDRFRAFEDRVKQARVALEEAWRLNQNQPYVARRMLVVEKSIGGGDRQAMETWFERAMTTDGNDREACWTKLDWLDPKWYGGDSTDEMVAFGRACWATKNWHNGLSLLVVDAHNRKYTKLDPQVRGEYLHNLSIHSEICEAFEDHLKHYPNDYAERSKYAALCYLGGWIGQAHTQFVILGDHLTQWPTFPNVPLARLREYRERSAQMMKDHLAGKTPAKP